MKMFLYGQEKQSVTWGWIYIEAKEPNKHEWKDIDLHYIVTQQTSQWWDGWEKKGENSFTK